MPQFCMLFYANYTIVATQRGGSMAQCPPLNTPLVCTVWAATWGLALSRSRWLLSTDDLCVCSSCLFCVCSLCLVCVYSLCLYPAFVLNVCFFMKHVAPCTIDILLWISTALHPGPWLGGSGPPRKLKKDPPPKRLNLHIFAIGLSSHLTFTYLRRTTFLKPGLWNSTKIYS